MAQVEMYMKTTCGFSHAAMRLLDNKNVAYTKIDLLSQPGKRPEMIQKAGGRSTVPQIFINGQDSGGYDDLNALNASGKLDPLLAA